MKKIILFLMVLFTTVCYAQSDFDVAQEFMSKKGVKLVPNKRSATRGTDTPYSIFNGSDGKGFCIVANGDVVGYDTSNTIDVDNMPCCLELILSKCSKIGKTRSDYTPDWWTPRNVTPINPLLTTHWHQDSPYNDILQRSGICTIIAFTQILHYFRVPQTYMDWTTNNGDVFPMTSFNHDLMLDEYLKGKYTEEEKKEIANFINYYGNIDFDGLVDAYGMEEHWVTSDKNNYYKHIDECLEQGIPFWVGGKSLTGTGGHAFVIDGRDSEGRYHANLGWGGEGDGYYVLADCEEHYDTYNGKNRIEKYMNTCSSGFYYIVPRLFSWNYTTDMASHKINTAYVNSDAYNLQGIKVGTSLEGLPKGIYIQNKKKHIIK
jgi:hypothetical protein